MRWYIVRTLLDKEVKRQLANRGGLVLAALMIVAALLMTFFNQEGGQPGVLAGGVEHCFLHYWAEDDWVRHLQTHVPPPLKARLKIEALRAGEEVAYPPGTGAIQIRTSTDREGQPQRKVQVWYPGQDHRALAEYEIWFWRETARYFQGSAAAAKRRFEMQTNAPATPASSALEHEEQVLRGGADMRSAITTGLVMFALFFSCVYLMPSLMCEERERGILAAQALSPASSLEILAAKFLFYPVAGVGLAAVLAGITSPPTLTRPFFWLVLLVAAVGSLGIGLTIASLARTQRTASMGALCYMLVVALFMFICQQGHIVGPPYLALEYHCPRMLHAVLADAVHWYHWLNLTAAALLAIAWCALANRLFRTRGWQ